MVVNCSLFLFHPSNSSPLLMLQRAWLLKLLAVELHAADMSSSNHREACQNILSQLFGGDVMESGMDQNVSDALLQNKVDVAAIRMISKIKVMGTNIVDCCSVCAVELCTKSVSKLAILLLDLIRLVILIYYCQTSM